MKRIYLLAGFLLSNLVLFAQPDWYKNVKFVGDDPYRFDWSFHISYKKGLDLDGTPANGKVYAKFRKADFDRIWARPGHEEVLELIKVTDQNKPTFIKHFRDIGTAEVPFLLQLAGEVFKYVGYAVKLLEVAQQVDADRKTTAAELAGQIALAGEFERRVALSLKEAGKYYVTILTIYKIKVGSEDRRYVVARTVYAIKVE
jgi:hypothetical protein